MAIDPVPREERLLEVAAVAHRLSVSRDYVYALIRDGHLPGYRLPNRHWRVRWTDLQQFIDHARSPQARPVDAPRPDAPRPDMPRPVSRPAGVRSSTH
jgi:excisionase family DNA binding protein